MQKGLLSICCLGYNHASFLKENLDSIAKINYPHIEVIVVDDGSKDNSVELLTQLKDSYAFPISVIAQKNTGIVGLNFNNAMKLAKGEYITFIALDDVFYPKTIEQELKIMNDNPNYAFVASNKAISITNDGYVRSDLPSLPSENISKPSLQELLEFEYNELGAFYIQGSIFKTALIQAVGGFDEDMTGDDIVLRTKIFHYLSENKQWEYLLLNKNNVFYRLHDNNIHKNSIRQIKIVAEYLERYWNDRIDPKIFVDTVLFLINKNYDNYSKIYNINNRTKKLLESPEHQPTLTCIKNKQRGPISYVFLKKMIDINTNEITLFRIFSFRYQRKQKAPKVTNIHYTNFNE